MARGICGFEDFLRLWLLHLLQSEGSIKAPRRLAPLCITDCLPSDEFWIQKFVLVCACPERHASSNIGRTVHWVWQESQAEDKTFTMAMVS